VCVEDLAIFKFKLLQQIEMQSDMVRVRRNGKINLIIEDWRCWRCGADGF